MNRMKHQPAVKSEQLELPMFELLIPIRHKEQRGLAPLGDRKARSPNEQLVSQATQRSQDNNIPHETYVLSS